MLETYPCPVCHEESWQPIQRFRYRESDAASGPILRGRRARNKLAWLYSCIVHNRPWPLDVALPMARTLTRHQLLRWRILFEKWLPGHEEVWLTSQTCGECGFVAYSPRPTEEDI
jgi:hypothetical protein